MNFQYRARGAGGVVQTGTVEFANQDGVVDWIRKQGWVPISVTEAGEKGSSKSRQGTARRSLFAPRIRLKDKALAFRQMSTMVAAGITVAGALNILEDQIQNKALAAAFTRVGKGVAAGFSLGTSLRREAAFSPLMVALIQAGEEGGVLDLSLQRLSDFLEKQEALRRKVLSAVTYPLVVLLVCALVMVLLVFVVIPKFSAVFSHLGVPLPWVTRAMFGSALWLKDHLPHIGVALALSALALLGLRRLESFRNAWDKWKLRMPLFGDILYKSVLARSFRTFGTLVASGVPLLQCLEMSSQVADNHHVARSYLTLRDAAEKGVPLHAVAKKNKLFPPMVCHMMAIGEETGKLEEMLGKIADWYEMELEEKVKQLTSILEPVLILFVGGVVALVALAIFLPITQAIQSMM